jgi:ABC-type uncharacterized transport system permease subunit
VSVALVHIALLAYAAAAAVYLAWLVRPRERWQRLGRVSLLVGLLVHLASFAPLPIGLTSWRSGPLFSLLAAALVLVYLLLDLRRPLPVAGVFVAPVAVAVMVPAHLVDGAQRAVAPALARSAALVVHVASATAGTAALALAFLLSVVYLAGEQQLKAKRLGRLFSRLPSLERLDGAGFRLVVWGFVFLSVSIATGSLASREATGALLSAVPKQAFAVGAWALLAALVQARLVAGWRGRRLALMAAGGFALVVGSYGALLSRSGG